MEKPCKTCHKILSIEMFSRNARRKDGRETMCKECMKPNEAGREKNLKSQKNWRDKNKDYQTKWRKSNPNRREYEKQYYKTNKNLYIERKQVWRNQHPDRELRNNRSYRESNKNKVNEYAREWKAKKRITNVAYKIKENLSRRIRYELSTSKSKSTCHYLGCSIEFLKTYLESKFLPYMSWENYGNVWHIDHIVPCSSWDLTKEFDNYCCWNYKNLQPLLKKEIL
jgi:hypothetical protein